MSSMCAGSNSWASQSSSAWHHDVLPDVDCRQVRVVAQPRVLAWEPAPVVRALVTENVVTVDDHRRASSADGTRAVAAAALAHSRRTTDR